MSHRSRATPTARRWPVQSEAWVSSASAGFIKSLVIE